MSDSGQTLWEGRFLAIRSRRSWEYVTRTNAQNVVAILPLTSRREVVLVEQFRQPLERYVIELPAGLVGDDAGCEDEPPVLAAQRELREETGYVSTRWTELMSGPTSAGLTDETIVLFLAENAVQVEAGGGTEHEEITVHVVPLAEVGAWLEACQRNDRLVDFKVLAGLYFAQQRGLQA